MKPLDISKAISQSFSDILKNFVEPKPVDGVVQVEETPQGRNLTLTLSDSPSAEEKFN